MAKRKSPLIFLSAVFKSFSEQVNPTMAGVVGEISLQMVFGKAFLVELQRGDLETAKVFARAFLTRTALTSKCPIPLAAS